MPLHLEADVAAVAALAQSPQSGSLREREPDMEGPVSGRPVESRRQTPPELLRPEIVDSGEQSAVQNQVKKPERFSLFDLEESQAKNPEAEVRMRRVEFLLLLSSTPATCLACVDEILNPKYHRKKGGARRQHEGISRPRHPMPSSMSVSSLAMGSLGARPPYHGMKPKTRIDWHWIEEILYYCFFFRLVRIGMPSVLLE